MRATHALLALATLAAVATPVAAEVRWKEFSSGDGRFRAQFPGTPKAQTQSLSTELGTVEQKFVSVEFEGVAFYAVAYVDYPKDTVSRAAPDTVLDGARDGAVKNVKGRITSESRIGMHGFPGREIVITASPPGVTMTIHMYLVRERLYQALTVVPIGKTVETRRFFESFRFDAPAPEKPGK